MSSIPDNNRREPDLQIEILVDDEISDQVDERSLRGAVNQSAAYRQYDQGNIGIRVTTDRVIRQINRDFLKHDFPTDVISFPYQNAPPIVEGELVVSLDTAARRAAELGWATDHELMLYVVHGTLHLTGMDDADPEDRAKMRIAEAAVMTSLGIADMDRFAADIDPPLQEERA